MPVDCKKSVKHVWGPPPVAKSEKEPRRAEDAGLEESRHEAKLARSAI
jgi:hypothetical protein